ncbi:uncharacterized protein [Musca autumnalis]|uniref:uncharacterized protein n=1 Tax=Musca autumnalis TaxID=221902 RepID=UPI003CEA4B00
MPSLNQTVIDESEFMSCGEIMVAGSGKIAMKCQFCKCKPFTRLQSFMRHVYQTHNDRIKFKSNADFMVYAVEELVNRTLREVDDSEESGVAEDDFKWSDDDEDEIVERKSSVFKALCQKAENGERRGGGKQSAKKKVAETALVNDSILNALKECDVTLNLEDATLDDTLCMKNAESVKGAALANMSILNALEDCDVSLNFVEDLDETVVEKEEEKEEEEENKKSEVVGEARSSESANTDNEEDCDMNSTLLKRIQMDLELEADCHGDSKTNKNKKSKLKELLEEDENQQDEMSSEEDELNATLTENNASNEGDKSNNSSKKSGLKNLLSGLEGLEDVDDLLDNIEYSIMIPITKDADNDSEKERKEKMEVEEQSVKDTNLQKRKSILELKLMADLDMDELDLEDCLNSSVMPNENATTENEAEKQGSPICEKKEKSNKISSSDSKANEKSSCREEGIDMELSKKTSCSPSSSKSFKNASIKQSNSKKCQNVTPKSTKASVVSPNNNQKSPKADINPKDTTKSRKASSVSQDTSPELHKMSPKFERNDNDTPRSKKRSLKSKKTSVESVSRSPAKADSLDNKEMLETKKFEEGLSEDNTSTFLCAENKLPTEEVGNDVREEEDATMVNDLKALLSKDLDDEDDLDMLINQLETSRRSGKEDNKEDVNVKEDNEGNDVQNLEKVATDTEEEMNGDEEEQVDKSAIPDSEDSTKNEQENEDDERKTEKEEETEKDKAISAENTNEKGEPKHDNEKTDSKEDNDLDLEEKRGGESGQRSSEMEEKNKTILDTEDNNGNEKQIHDYSMSDLEDDDENGDLQDDLAIYNKFLGLTKEDNEEEEEQNKTQKDKPTEEKENNGEKDENESKIQKVTENETQKSGVNDRPMEKSKEEMESKNEDLDDEDEKKIEKQDKRQCDESTEGKVTSKVDAEEKSSENSESNDHELENSENFRLHVDETMNNKSENASNISEADKEKPQYEIHDKPQKEDKDKPQEDHLKKIKENEDSKVSDQVIAEDKDLENNLENDEDMDDFENLLNEDLTKALERALGDDNEDLLNMDDGKEEVENKDNTDTAENPNSHKKEEESKAEIPKDVEKNKADQEKPVTEMGMEQTTPPKSTTKTKKVRSAKKENREVYQGKFSKTNQKARSKQGKPVISGQENNKTNINPAFIKESTKIQVMAAQIMKSPMKTLNSLPKSPLKTLNNLPKSPLKTLNNINNSPNKKGNSPKMHASGELLQANPSSESLKLVGRTPSTRRLPQQRGPLVSTSQIKKEKITPARSFVNIDRGDRTPMKVEDLFTKQSPKTQEKSEEKQNKSLTPKTPEFNTNKKSPSQCKMNLVKANLIKTPTTTAQTNAMTLSPSMRAPSISPTSTKDSLDVQTPQKTRNLSVKIMRCTSAQKSDQLQFKTPSSQKYQKSPSVSPQSVKQSPNESPKNLPNLNTFKLPKGITITKVPAVANACADIEITPSRSSYCKQNFTEKSLQEQQQQESVNILTQNKEKEVSTESLIKSMPSSITVTKTDTEAAPTSLASRLRARQASIDIVTNRSPANKNHNLDYKSYAVIRSARKKEVLQRMRTIKKQIFKSIGNEVIGQHLRTKSPLIKKSRRSKIQIENVQILPNIKDEVLTPMLNKQNISPQVPTNHLATTTQPSPKTSMINFEKSLTPTTANKSPMTSPKRNEEELLPNPTPATPKQEGVNTLNNITPQSPTSPTTTTNNSDGVAKNVPKTPPTRNAAKTPSTKKAPKTPSAKKGAKTPSTRKRRATSPLDEAEQQIKRSQKSPIQEEKVAMESTELGLSDSVVDFLQRDLKANRINVESILSEEMPIDDVTPDETPESSLTRNTAASKEEDITKMGHKKKPNKEESNKENLNKVPEEKLESKKDVANDDKEGDLNKSHESEILDELLEQVEDEIKPKQIKAEIKTESKTANTKMVEDYNEERDLELLEKIGLRIIKSPDIEDFHTLEEIEEIQKLANNFATVCRQFHNVFGSKQAETEGTFEQLLKKVNGSLKLNLQLRDIKRLINLIVMWYANWYNNKLIEKKSIPDLINKYLLMFFYIPKTVKRIYYCEFCPEHFNTEHRYYTHRIIHTGAKTPYQCKHCGIGFSRNSRLLKDHENGCASKHKASLKDINLATKVCTNDRKQDIKKCENSQSTASYLCAKCNLSFGTESEMNYHLSICFRGVRRQPKMCTPRPKVKTEPYSKN